VGGLPFGQYRLLAEQVPDVVDLNAAYTGLRLVKSAEEVAALRRGADLSDAAIAALAQALRPGATDHEALARAEHAYVAQGGLHHIHYLGITSPGDRRGASAAARVSYGTPAGGMSEPLPPGQQHAQAGDAAFKLR